MKSRDAQMISHSSVRSFDVQPIQPWLLADLDHRGEDVVPGLLASSSPRWGTCSRPSRCAGTSS